MNSPNLTRHELERLIASEGGPHLSLYLPPPRTVNDTLEEEKRRLGNLVRSARDLLTEHWMSAIEADAICSYLRRYDGIRLILAGVDSLTDMYRANSNCNNIVKHTRSGNVDHLTAEELQARTEAVAGEAVFWLNRAHSKKSSVSQLVPRAKVRRFNYFVA